MRKLPVLLLSLALAAGCASGPSDRAQPSTTTQRTAPITPTAPPASPAADATALVNRMLDDAVLPPGAAPAHVKLTGLMRGPWEVPSGDNVVHANRVWTSGMPPDAVVAFLRAHPPSGFDGSGVGQSSSPTERVFNVTDTLRSLPANVAQAGIEVGVETRGRGALINVVAGVQWTPVRPAAEHVDARDPVVSVRSLYPYRKGQPTIRRAVVTGGRAAAVARTFDALRVGPVGVVHGCPALSARTVAYEISFAPSAAAPADVVASLGVCSGVVVTVHGKPALNLTLSPEFEQAVATAFGTRELHFMR